MMPTILEATGSYLPETSAGKKRIAWDGRSILPSLLGQKQKDPAVLFFHHAGVKQSALEIGNSSSIRTTKRKPGGNSMISAWIRMN